MKILQINTICNSGSIGKIMDGIQDSVTKKGYESYIACGRTIKKNGHYIKIGNKIDAYAHAFITRIFDRHGFGSKIETKKFIKKIIKINPDIIHLHNIHGYYLNVEILFSYLQNSKKPVIWTMHDCWAITGHCSYFENIGCEKWQNHCEKCPQKKMYPKSILFDNSKKNYFDKKKIFNMLNQLTIVSPSIWLEGTLKKSYLKSKDIRIINNGIDLDIFKPSESNFREKFNLIGKFIILGVASVWENRKGLQYFIELNKNLEKDEIIVLVGLNKKQVENIPKNIVALSKTNNSKELSEIYSSADVFLNPTLDEVLGMTNIEALACGTPVITFNSGGSPECIDSKTGLIIQDKNTNEIRKSISKMKDERISTLDCLDRSKLFDKKIKFQEYVNLYEEIFEKSKNL